MKKYDIAVIGISGRFPGADNIKSFRELLKRKKCTISELSEKRRKLMGLGSKTNYIKCGYIEDIDLFDNKFFDITNREARLISPEQRMSLELVAETIYDAGYSLEGFRGANCGVFVAGGASNYNSYIKRQSSTSVIGSEPYMLSGRIGYMFDLRGENITLNSGCSSSIVAINAACEKLRCGDIDSAIVGGVIIYVEPLEAGNNMYDILGIMSPEYELHAFDQKANGTVIGEGGGYVLLKRLEDAMKDHDHIYGVIKSCNVNSDGGRCESVSMPSADAQRDVVLNAWDDIDVSGLTEIEAHGIGALLGDAVEAGGLVDAIKKHNAANKEIILSSVKSNIGHLVTASGMSSFIKVMMGYKFSETYPVVGMENISNMIHFDKVGVEILHDVKQWGKSEKRMTGISSFGLSGCNAHMVVENYPDKVRRDIKIIRPYKLSAYSEIALSKMCRELAEYLSENNHANGDIAFTLNAGRDDFAYRAVIVAADKEELCSKLSQISCTSEKNQFKVVVAAKNEGSCTGYDEILGEYPAVSGYSCERIKDTLLRKKTALYRFIEGIGIKYNAVLLDKVFRTALDVAVGVCGPDVIETAISENPRNNDYSAYRTHIEELSRKSEDKLFVIDFSDTGTLCDMDNGDSIRVVNPTTAKGFAELIAFLYSSGSDIKWRELYRNTSAERLSLPGYLFERESFWFRNEGSEGLEVQDKEMQKVSVSPLTKQILSSRKMKKIFYMNYEQVDEVDLTASPYAFSAFKRDFYPVTGDIDVDYKLTMYRVLERSGVSPDVVIADEKGAAGYRYLRGWINRNELMDVLDVVDDSASGNDRGISAIRSIAKNSLVVVFDLSHDGRLKEELNDSDIIVMNLSNLKDLEAALAMNSGTVSDGEDTDNMSENVENTIAHIEKVKEVVEKSAEQIEAESFLKEVWIKSLGRDDISHTDNFFSLGGNSLIMQSMSEIINDHFNKSFDIFELYENETIEKLAAVILAA